MDPRLIGLLIDRAIRVLYMAEVDDFDRIFGLGGPHLWGKFINNYNRSEGSFICSLDHGNLEKLALAAIQGLVEDETLLKERQNVEEKKNSGGERQDNQHEQSRGNATGPRDE